MELVAPIKDKSEIEKVKEVLKVSSERDYLLFIMGINSALRISDLLSLKKSDVATGRVIIKEQKTKKRKEFPLNRAIMEVLESYLKGLNDDDYLFTSRQSSNGVKKPISRQQAYTNLTNAFNKAGIKAHCGSHTLRKTWGYHTYKATKDIARIMKALNHSSQSITLRYIGCEQEEIDKLYYDFCL